jgi:membrane-associated protein
MTLALVPLLASLGSAALLLLVGVVFAETGLLVGFFLPGDSILFAAGLFVSTGVIPLPLSLVLAATWAAAVAGDQVGYSIGHRVGPRLFASDTSRWWSRRHLEAARRFFDRHGTKAVVLARFVPGARTFTPVVAGAVGMPRRRFTAYNVAGGLGWTLAMILAGFFLGGVQVVAAHVELFTLGLIALSLVPAAIAMVRRRRRIMRHNLGKIAVRV